MKQIRKQKFTYLFDLFANPRTAVISLLSGIKKRFGFDYRYRRNAYTQTYSPPDPNLHLMRLFAEFFAEFGFKGKIVPPDLIPDPEFYEHTDKFFAANNLGKTVVAVNPHTTYPSKAWPREHFIKFIELWHNKFDSPVIITWGPGEKNAAQEIVKDAGSDKAVLQPEVNIIEFAAFLSRLNLFVTADTGPMNIAWAVNTPTVALFGPTTRKAVAPEGPQHLSLFNPEIECLQCHQEVCSHKSCMYSMKPEWVFDKIIKKYKLDKNS
ncbi:MAG: glycosyltransferase family 9 protein [Candidatus Rifleibacteriota bacterium]